MMCRHSCPGPPLPFLAPVRVQHCLKQLAKGKNKANKYLQVTYALFLTSSSHLTQGHGKIPQTYLGRGKIDSLFRGGFTNTLSLRCCRAPSKQVLAVSQSLEEDPSQVRINSKLKLSTCFIM